MGATTWEAGTSEILPLQQGGGGQTKLNLKLCRKGEGQKKF